MLFLQKFKIVKKLKLAKKKQNKKTIIAKNHQQTHNFQNQKVPNEVRQSNPQVLPPQLVVTNPAPSSSLQLPGEFGPKSTSNSSNNKNKNKNKAIIII